MKKILLVDGHSILNRAFYGVPDLTDAKGRHTNAVYGFLNILFKVIDEEKPDTVTVAFDVKKKNFRHEMYAEYKGTRKPMPAELHEQVPMIQEVLASMNICVITAPGFEADDVIGTIAKRAEADGYITTIISGDRDLLQLVSDKVTLRIPKTKAGKTIVEDYDPAAVMEAYSLTPEQIIDLKGLMGDASDNIPGLYGVGEKTATKLLVKYGTVENVLAHVDEITPAKAKNAAMENGDLAILSKKLATIKTDCEIEYSFNDTDLENMFNENSYKLIKEFGFKSMLGRFDGQSMNKNERIEYDVCDDAYIAGLYVDGLSGKTALYLIEDEEEGLLGAAIWGGDKPCLLADMEKNEITEIVNKLLTSEKTDVIMFDIKEKLHLLDVSYNGHIWDAHVMAYLLNPVKDSYTAVDIAGDYLGRQIAEYKELFGKNSIYKSFTEERERYIDYVMEELSVLKDCYEVLAENLKEMGMYKLYTDIEMPLIFVLHGLEKEGIGVDKKALSEYGESLNEGINRLEQEIYGYAGEEFNINSPKQLGVILFEKLKLPHAKKTKTGYSTSADILEKLRIEDPIVPAVLEYRTLSKLKSTYADGLATFISADGRIHGKFNQTKTATGRISSLEPNLQNIPIRIELGRKIRKVFVPKEGCTFIDADYSQIELRVLAHMSGDESLISAYNEGQDIHSITASKVFHVDESEVTSELRRRAKAVNFGIVYGISSFGLSEDLGIGKKEAEEYIKRYFETYPKIKTFLDKTVEDAKTLGYSVTEYGRRRPIPELSSGNFMQRSFGERVAMNAPIQGTAADIMKIAMINVGKRLKDEGLKTKMILQVHDELLLEAPNYEVNVAKAILKEEMMNAANLLVKMEVEVGSGDDWYSVK
ncbi:MAG: DNA polymerase I [Lachnospiraceae bacterium]|nr:DNA polymerase I [Lachnospiraceae bacterium]